MLTDTLKSTREHRVHQRGNASAEILTSALKTISPIVAAPTKLTQAINSTLAFFKPIKAYEKAFHATQALIACAQAAMFFYTYFNDHDCKESSDVCKALLALDLVYQAILLSNWVPAELSRQALGAPPSPDSTLNSQSDNSPR